MDIITVKQLNTYIKSVIEGDALLYNVTVKGEISNFTNHYKSGHFYFSLKYEGALIRAVMFRSSAQKVRFEPRDGMLVLARGRVSVFERDGQYQLYVDQMTLDGAGDLYMQFELLKQKLSAKGLFDPARQKPIPKIPLRIGVVTSPTGAAVRDIINVLGRRFPAAKVILYPVLVQGEGAAAQICEAIEYFNRERAADVLIVGRGGGSIEDLWAFNEERVAYAIAASELPVISAVGHEIDFTIADFVADLRAPTPSAAAELAAPEVGVLMNRFVNLMARLQLLLINSVKAKRQRLDYVCSMPALRDPMKLINERRMLADHLTAQMTAQMRLVTSAAKQRSGGLTAKLESLSPLAVLGRGYTYMRGPDGRIIKSIGELNRGDTVSAVFADGSAMLTVDSTTPKEDI